MQAWGGCYLAGNGVSLLLLVVRCLGRVHIFLVALILASCASKRQSLTALYTDEPAQLHHPAEAVSQAVALIALREYAP